MKTSQTHIVLPQVGVQSEGRDWPAGAQEAAVRLSHQPVALQQSILGEQSQRGGVGEEQRQPEALRQRHKLLHCLLRQDTGQWFLW